MIISIDLEKSLNKTPKPFYNKTTQETRSRSDLPKSGKSDIYEKHSSHHLNDENLNVFP